MKRKILTLPGLLIITWLFLSVVNLMMKDVASLSLSNSLFVKSYGWVKDLQDIWLPLGYLFSLSTAFSKIKVRFNLFFQDDEQSGPISNDIKVNYFNQLKSEYKGFLSLFEQNRVLLGSMESIPLKFSVYKSIFNFKVKLHEESSKLISENILIEDNLGIIITGKAGNGKSWSMLSRLMQVMDEVNLSKKKVVRNLKIPFLLKLSGWEPMTQLLNEDAMDLWVMQQICLNFNIRDIASIKGLINGNHILVCLDGLDEVPEEYRDLCLESILNYRKKGRSVIFSCRKEELTKQLTDTFEQELFVIYEVLPLTKEEIGQVIEKERSADEAIKIKGFLNQHEDLWEHIKVPLLLNLFLKTFYQLTAAEIRKYQSLNTEDFLNLLWRKYDHLIFQHRLSVSRFKTRRFRRYATWVARLVPGSIFYVEQMQPDWLIHDIDPNESNFRLILYYLTSRIISSVLVSVAIGMIIASPLDFIGNGALAGIIIAFMTSWLNTNSSVKWDSNFQIFKNVALFTTVLVFFCAIYQGLLVPRRHEDMNGLFSITESFPGIICGLIYGLLFGFRKKDQKIEKDIFPVDKFSFNWKSAGRRGLFGGIWIGLFIAFCGAVVQVALVTTTFYRWLGPYITQMAIWFSKHQIIDVRNSYGGKLGLVFGFAFVVGSIVGFFVLAVTGGRDIENESDVNLRKLLNFGIRSCLRLSIIHALRLIMLIGISYGLVLYACTGNIYCFTKVLQISIGIGLLTMLWFGGFEVIHHWTLRLYLYLFGRAPFLLGGWLKQMHQVAFIQQMGGVLQFSHATLKTYLSNVSIGDVRRIKQKSKFSLQPGLYFTNALVIISSLYLIYCPIRDRYFESTYWQHKDEILVSHDNTLRDLGNQSYKVIKAGLLKISVNGNVKVGTFVGSVGPQGTETGFLGFPVNDAYNIIKGFRHGALLYKKIINKRPQWFYVTGANRSFMYWTASEYTIEVEKNEVLDFCINDEEWENDIDHFNMNIKWQPKK